MASRLRAVPTVVISIAALACAAIFGAPSSSAAPYSHQPTLSVSTQTPAEGSTITVTGADFVAGVEVTLTLHTVVVTLGSATPNSSGGFSRSVSLPAGVTGTHTIVASGGSANDTASVTIDIGAPAGGSTSSGGNLSSTGVAIIGIGSLGLLLLIGGGVTLLAGRRRKATTG